MHHSRNHVAEAEEGPGLVHVGQGKVRVEHLGHQLPLLRVCPAVAVEGRLEVVGHAGPHRGNGLGREGAVDHGQQQHLDGNVPRCAEHARAGHEHLAAIDLQGAVRRHLQHDTQQREDVHQGESDNEGVDGKHYQKMWDARELWRRLYVPLLRQVDVVAVVQIEDLTEEYTDQDRQQQYPPLKYLQDGALDQRPCALGPLTNQL
mmetsp:Transcript_50307/g.113025  ORF Transcript_50307/g.113025 Transcript_50307/m.113025 type:complete len:204 (+) Transcript_50307:909-1520(+)